MNRSVLALAAASLLSLVVACTPNDSAPSCPGDCGGGGAAGAGGWDSRFSPFVEALLADLAASSAYGVSAAVMERGEITFARAFGSKDPDGTMPLTPDTLMQIGSTTKQMTAVALLRKVEQGAISLDATLEQALPALDFARDPSWDDQITLWHLLTHQGAFQDTLLWGGTPSDSALASWVYGSFAAQSYLMNPPGAFWNYSNPNFVLAGLVTESLDDRAWPDLMLQDVFGPLGMNRTFLRKSEVEADGDYALSYGLGWDDLASGQMGPVAMATMPDPGSARPAGLAWTTPTQMMSWAEFLLRGNAAVLSDELRAELESEQVDTRYLAGNQHYGYGLMVERGYLTSDKTWFAVPVWEHGGNTLSFSHLFYVLPEQDFALAICSSGYSTDFQHSVDVAMTTLPTLPAPSPGPEYLVDPARFDLHVGSYEDVWNLGQVTITRQADQLLIDMPDVTAAGFDVVPELYAISSDWFMVTIDNTAMDLTFIPTVTDGPSTYIRNRAFVATRVVAPAQHAPPAPESIARWLEQARLTPDPVPYRPQRP
jgi:CubicO group peptidase (beta-lactamase class C family)